LGSPKRPIARQKEVDLYYLIALVSRSGDHCRD
jgi:hypothetical protein